jgi:hypothetical protein
MTLGEEEVNLTQSGYRSSVRVSGEVDDKIMLTQVIEMK